jgi:hypothetical protein
VIRLEFPCFLENIDSVTVLLIDEEGRHFGSHPLVYDAEHRTFYLMFEVEQKLYYQLLINNQFVINNINCPHEIIHNKLVTLLTDEPAYYETGMTCVQSDTFYYLTESKRKSKKSFAFLRDEIYCSFTFRQAGNVLYLIEVIAPNGTLINLHEYVIVPGESLEHQIIVPRDQEIYGKWRINVYSSGEFVTQQHFRLVPAHRYSYKTPRLTQKIDIQF